MASSEPTAHRQPTPSSRLRPYWLIPPIRTSSGTVGVVTPSGEGVRAVKRVPTSNDDAYLERIAVEEAEGPARDLMLALVTRGAASGGWEVEFEPLGTPEEYAAGVEDFAATTLVVPRSERWREAVSTALMGDSWCEPLARTGHLPTSALGTLKAEARTLHQQLVPIWRRGTRHGKVLSLEADFGGVSLGEVIGAEVDYLTHIANGKFDDERLNTVLRGLTPNERHVVIAYALGGATNWTEAGVAAGVADPAAFGERVRRKLKRLAAEQRRRLAQRRIGAQQVTSAELVPNEVAAR
ncbi:hypothetical protein [Streptomyces chartreusis]|uniref:hypothetical protein n=1 Tax=Streptomyces chartreusis TaxID=1969 RepID=UPI00365F3C59